MSNTLTGVLNGTDVKLAIETTPSGGVFSDIGGLISNSLTANNGAIDITNKTSDSFREILDGEGLQSMDLTAEIVFSTDANFAIMKAGYTSKANLLYQMARGAEVIEGEFYITSWAESSPDNDKVTVSVSLQSNGAWTGV